MDALWKKEKGSWNLGVQALSPGSPGHPRESDVLQEGLDVGTEEVPQVDPMHEEVGACEGHNQVRLGGDKKHEMQEAHTTCGAGRETGEETLLAHADLARLHEMVGPEQPGNQTNRCSRATEARS